MAPAAGTSLSSLPHSSMGRFEVIMVERFFVTPHNDPVAQLVPPQFNCYCAPPSGPKGHGLSKLRVSVLYVRGPIFSQFWSALETYASMLALNFFICSGVSQTYSFPL